MALHQPAMRIHVERKALQVESLLKYAFTNKRIAVEAVQMAAPRIAVLQNNSVDPIVLNNNKRLAVLGDAELTKVLCSAWFHARGLNGQVLSQAQWTDLRNESLSNDALARRGYKTGLDKCIITNDSKPAVSLSMMATTLEAVIAAVYQDGGDEAAQRIIRSLGFLDHPLLTTMSGSLLPPP